MRLRTKEQDVLTGLRPNPPISPWLRAGFGLPKARIGQARQPADPTTGLWTSARLAGTDEGFHLSSTTSFVQALGGPYPKGVPLYVGTAPSF